jgi:SAM-dependent methyltransferase
MPQPTPPAPAVDPADIARHYSDSVSRRPLVERLHAALLADGADPQHPTIATLAPYDQFHGRGLEATQEMADQLAAHIRPEQHLLDIGCGIGGPARYFAQRFGCRVTGIDLTPEFCELARELTVRVAQALAARGEPPLPAMHFDLGDALAMPYDAARFDGAFSMNVSMNIADKAGLYREIHRVLRPGGWLMLSEIARASATAAPPDYPTPWAATAAASFLSTPDEIRAGLVEAGFEVAELHSTRAQSLDFATRSRAAVARGDPPPHRSVQLIHGEHGALATTNTARALADGRIDPLDVLAWRR